MAKSLSGSRKQFWEEHITQWSASELSQAEYCGLHGISLKSFQYWRRKAKLLAAPALVELPLPVSLVSARPQLCVVIDQRYRIEVGKGFDSVDLERVVRVLERM